MDPFVGELRAFPFNFAPTGWALCDGSLLSIAQNAALFSLLGTMYGGNGTTNFGLPDLRGRVPMGAGIGPGLTPRTQGDLVGTENVTLTTGNLPPHTHSLNATTAAATGVAPTGALLAAGQVDAEPGYASGAPDTALAANAIGATGTGAAVSVVQPSQVITWCIATVGIYPSRP